MNQETPMIHRRCLLALLAALSVGGAAHAQAP
jgi:hypothetical protein